MMVNMIMAINKFLMKKERVLFSILLLGAMSLFAQNCYGQPACLVSFQKSINNLEHRISGVDFTEEVSCFEWDEIIVVAPSFSKKRFTKITKISLPYSIKYNSSMIKDSPYWTIVFLNKRNVISYIKISRKEFDFSKLRQFKNRKEDWFFLNRNESSFRFYSKHPTFFINKKRNSNLN